MTGLLFITHQTERYSYLDSMNIALQGGCRHIQLRMKELPLSDVMTIGKQAQDLCSKYGATLYVDDHVEVCKNIGATGVHLGKSDMAPHVARQILGANSMIGGTAIPSKIYVICMMKGLITLVWVLFVLQLQKKI